VLETTLVDRSKRRWSSHPSDDYHQLRTTSFLHRSTKLNISSGQLGSRRSVSIRISARVAVLIDPSTDDDPSRIEPSVRRAVIWEPCDVPTADEWGVGSPDRRSSADVDHAAGIASNHVCRLLGGAYGDDGAVVVGKSRNGAIGAGPEQDDV